MQIPSFGFSFFLTSDLIFMLLFFVFFLPLLRSGCRTVRLAGARFRAFSHLTGEKKRKERRKGGEHTASEEETDGVITQESRTVIASQKVHALFAELFLSTGPKSVVQGDVIAMVTKSGGEKEDPERVETPDRMRETAMTKWARWRLWFILDIVGSDGCLQWNC